MGMSDNVLIDLKEIHFAHAPDRVVLHGANLTVLKGDRIGVTGPNGSGKTTLLHLIVGLLHPQSGEIEVAGQPRHVEEDFRDVRTQVGLLFQDSEDQLFCPTVSEDVAFGPLNLGATLSEAEEIVRDTLGRLGLAGFEERVTYRLSFGEKRLVALATVLAMRPRVLLLDEPTNGLDSAVWERLARFLASLETTLVVVSHDRPFLKRVVSTEVTLTDGRLSAPTPL